MLPLLITLVPSLVKVAESVFAGHEDAGSAKKEFVMNTIATFYDRAIASHVPDLPLIDERKLFLDICSNIVDEVARVMTK